MTTIHSRVQANLSLGQVLQDKENLAVKVLDVSGVEYIRASVTLGCWDRFKNWIGLTQWAFVTIDQKTVLIDVKKIEKIQKKVLSDFKRATGTDPTQGLKKKNNFLSHCD